MGSETFLEVILAILLPPVGVFLRYGCGHIRNSDVLSMHAGGVLDLCVADNTGIHTGHYLCTLCLGWIV
ncbi:hypothetical protein H5410_022348 [Solanum commersonii]|uniref:Uncharacterized protein n=1 Tax=Solanum commersonii TaxID=4109 RepID=A0A9J5ZDQ4_SOLCO|nr:hypothetical protein H5410_022348 [Solanum commersonii]